MNTIVTKENIQELRTLLDAPYNLCIEALRANENSVALAAEWLRQKSKVEERTSVTKHGVIAIAENSTSILALVVGCETDFVSRNPIFISLVDEFANSILLVGFEKAKEKFMEKAWVFKENIQVKENLLLSKDADTFVSYVHHDRTRASLVTYKGLPEAAKKIALQVCALQPKCVSRKSVDPKIISSIYDTAKQEAIANKKPEAIAEKIAEGKLKNYLKDFVLKEQAMFDNPKLSVEQYLTENDLEVYAFHNFTVN
jgi:elongation factor Ts